MISIPNSKPFYYSLHEQPFGVRSGEVALNWPVSKVKTTRFRV